MTKRLREADIPDRDMAIVLQMFYWVWVSSNSLL